MMINKRFLLPALLVLFSSIALADIELSVEQVQAFNDGGCFYVVATPTNGETIDNYVLAFNTDAGTDLGNPPLDTTVSGLTPQADFVSFVGGWSHVGQGDFGITESFPVAQFTYETNSPQSVTFEITNVTTFNTAGGNLDSSNGLVIPSIADSSVVFAHANTMFSGVCAPYQAVPEPSSFLFLTLVLSGWSWKKRRQRIAQRYQLENPQ